MGDNQGSWEFKTADDVASALDWVRRRMKGNGLVLVAIGVKTIAFAKDAKIEAGDAVQILEEQLPALRKELERISAEKVTRGTARREV